MLTKPDTPQGGVEAQENVPPSAEGRQTPDRRRLGRWLTSALIVAVAAGAYFYWFRAKAPEESGMRGGDMRVPVLAATPRVADVPVYLTGVGTVRALNSVTVRAQVDGRLSVVHFREGQDVVQGDVLAEIDPAIYQAQYDQTVAKKAQDEALLANARIDLARYQKLAASNAGSKQQADTQAAQVAQIEAQVRADQAAIDNAKATLGYTRITAPIAGRTGFRQVDQGNIVRASDAAGIVIITQIKPVAVQFSLPQQHLDKIKAAVARGTVDVDVFGPDGSSVIASGPLTVIDNQVDPTTGTVKLKAEFANASLQLWPGQFVNVRVRVETLSNALVVPTSAVQRGPAGAFAYVIGADNVVTARAVTVAQQSDTEAAIASGLNPTDQVVTTGFNSLSEGAKVVIGTGDRTPSPDLAPKARPDGPGGGGKGGPPRPGGGARH
jgi:multidrug efflux system membrane fusion protein